MRPTSFLEPNHIVSPKPSVYFEKFCDITTVEIHSFSKGHKASGFELYDKKIFIYLLHAQMYLTYKMVARIMEGRNQAASPGNP